MRLFAKIFLCLSILMVASALNQERFPKHFQPQIKKMVESFYQLDTSKAFSIAMKLFVSVDGMTDQLSSIKLLNNQLSQGQTCFSLLREVVEISKDQTIAQQYQTLLQKMRKLQGSCTNRDFQYGLQQVQGGFQNKCALCVIITKVMQNYISIHKRDVTDFIQREFCDLFDGFVRPTCQAFVHYAGPTIINLLLKKQSADTTCLALGMCKNPDCKITQSRVERLLLQVSDDGKPAPWDWLVHIFVDKFGDGHLPPFYLDNDTFSDVSTFRGHHWRGADCDQINKNVYPGRKDGSKIVDHDCNGIFGINGRGKTYEKLFCTESKRFGVAVIGDSAGAHFSIPQKYFNASMINGTTYHDLLYRVADELDIPHQSGYTGHTKTEGYTRHSVYKYARQWNLCNHNDYQNVGVNGGDSGNSWGNIKALKRDQQKDHPMLVFMELIGNDVCSHSINSMTKEPQFKANILKLLNYLDTVLPAGSHLVILGLADGDLLYENLHDVIHPLNVTYQTVYNFLNCLDISPCTTWLNSNDTIRKITTQRAVNLSRQYQAIIQQGHTYKNFDIAYYDFPALEILQRKIMEGGNAKDMIERCDGFHPNGQFHSYLGDWLWNKIQTSHSEWIGDKNPFNDQIRKIFGHQVYN